MNNKTRTILLFLHVIIFVLVLFPSMGRALEGVEELSVPTEQLRKFKNDVGILLDGGSINNKAREKYICAVSRQVPFTEVQKVEYNHLFHEIQSEEQIEAIRNWVAAVKELKGWFSCKKAMQLWNDYDNKWYAPKRNAWYEEHDRLEKKWASEIVDRGKDIFDTHVNGTFLSIPRAYITSDHFKADGPESEIAMRFRYPDMDSEFDPDPVYEKKNQIRGIMQAMLFQETLPCYGFKGRMTCTQNLYNRSFSFHFTDCYDGEIHKEGTPYKGFWRKACGYRGANKGGKNLKPVFDKEVGLWRIGQTGFYEGEPEFPEYWLECEKLPKDMNPKQIKQGTCESAVLIGKDLVFSYFFPRRMFWEHKKIHDGLKAKIESFIIKTE